MDSNTRRKRLLFAVLGVVAVLVVGDRLRERFWTQPHAARQDRLRALDSEIRQKFNEMRQADEAISELDIFRTQALPSNTEVARSLYQAWLLELVGQIGLVNPNVDSGEPVARRRGQYHELNFSIRGRGNLAQLTHLLHEFYRAPHLHRIRSLNITPLASQGMLDINLSIEALRLENADRENELADGVSDRLVYSTIDDYMLIAQRNLFGIGGSYDDADHVVLTAITTVDQHPLAWFTVRTTDESFRLPMGGEFSVGRLSGSVIWIQGTEAMIYARGEYWLLTIGETLAEAVAIPPEAIPAFPPFQQMIDPEDEPRVIAAE